MSVRTSQVSVVRIFLLEHRTVLSSQLVTCVGSQLLTNTIQDVDCSRVAECICVCVSGDGELQAMIKCAKLLEHAVIGDFL